MFQRVGASAYKKDLTNTLKLCKALDNPERKFKAVHVAGTNGKGSCSHYTASILQEAGFKTGLYTSPHLKNFTERIKINGEEIPQQAVVNFVNKNRLLVKEIQPSFFEITVAMAFDYFAKQEVDIAVVEVGMGGRLDSTNVINPEVSLITNISYDHQQWLGDSLEKIAAEKAGIIKENTPVVISEKQEKIFDVFKDIAASKHAPITLASDAYQCLQEDSFKVLKDNQPFLEFPNALLASYQTKNLPAVLSVVDALSAKGFKINQKAIKNGIQNMVTNTGLKGRWQTLQQQPKIICDVGHNEAGMRLIVKQLQLEEYNQLHIVFGTVNDKDVKPVLKLLPKEANFYFCQADIPRAMPVNDLKDAANAVGLTGVVCGSVKSAIATAKNSASADDLIFVGGSTFVVAELDEL
ncbi:bifunctional folylpolyglutamate synthase/dihydrofolate synthase [Fulvivirga sp. RKSG066]|nr:folylpolyglutamate synthase/dihydrofolate synthase family protein [Fulvivirga aurantia]MTI20134.1 bifunctional folylpolyglutamate synthase/dihydrofolate synthase [Fulvivirga aurantia]